MKIIKAGYEIFPDMNKDNILQRIEQAGRVCYAKGTEILTNTGFKKVEDISQQDKVLTYNAKKNILEYQDANMVSYRYCGDMINSNNSKIQFSVTPDHRMYVASAQDRQYEFMEAKYLMGIPSSKRSIFRIPKFFIGATNNSVDLKIDEVVTKEVRHGWRPSTTETICMSLDDNWLVLLASYISEGSVRHGEVSGSGSAVCIHQTEGTELYNGVITALGNLGLKYRINSDPRKPYVKTILFGSQLYVQLFETLCGRYSRDKHLPVWFRQLSTRQIKLLLHYLYLGDGSHNTTRHERYLSISKQLLEEVQECFILTGTNAYIGFDTNVSQKCYTEEALRDSWLIRRKNIYTSVYDDFVFCPSTDNGIVCVKYNNSIFWCGNCYKSESSMTSNSAETFCSNIIKRGHEAVLEHGVLCFEVSKWTFHILTDFNSALAKQGFKSFLRFTKCGRYIVSANVRAWRDFLREMQTRYQLLPYFLKHLVSSNPVLFPEWQTYDFGVSDEDDTFVNIDTSTLTHSLEIMIHHNVTVKFIVDRGVSHEIVRHRTASFCQESQRYCNYSKDKFGNEITFIEPLFWNEYSKEYTYWKGACSIAEFDYFSLLKHGATPQEARSVLPNSVKTEVVMTANCECWHHFFELRTSQAAHPQMREVALPLLKDFQKFVPTLFDDIEVTTNG